MSKLSLPTNKILLLATGLIGLVGFADSVYLTITHYTNAKVPCTLTSGCESVLQSSFSEVYGIPIALFGVLFYSVVIITTVVFLQNNIFKNWLWLWAALGFVTTLYLLFLQAFVLHAFCQYCLLSALSSSCIFILVSLLAYFNKKEKHS